MITSTQKEVLFREIFKFIERNKVQSLLDIGTGDGILAAWLAPKVSRYLAVEEDPERVKTLKGLGLDVIHATFPVEIAEQFDMVLASHSIPEERHLYEPFLESAWNLLKPHGTLLIVTFKGTRIVPQKLLDMCGKQSAQTHDEALYTTMLSALKNFGEVHAHKSTSVFQTGDARALADLAVQSIGPEKSERDTCAKAVAEVIEKEYCTDGLYGLPYEHVFLSVQKNS